MNGAIALIAGGVIAIGCSGGSSNPSTSTPAGPSAAAATTFQGTVAGSSRTGTIDITVQSAVASARRLSWPLVATLYAQGVSASGTVQFAGSAATALSGTYNGGTLSLSGGGLTIAGTAKQGVLAGTISGSVSGGFSTVSAATGAATRYCGTYTTVIPNQGYREEGTWNIEVAADGTVSGIHATVTPAPECCGFLTGRRDGNTVTFVTGEGKTVIGTIQGNVLSGSQPNGDGTTSFSGNTNACQ